MGLAASQGRYLCLTARNSDLIYEGQQIAQQRLSLATETESIAKKYTEAMNNQIMQVRSADGTTQQLTYELITNQDPFSGLCMRVVDLEGNVVSPIEEKYLEIVSQDAEGNDVVSKFASTGDFIEKYMNLSDEEKQIYSLYTLSAIFDYYNENKDKFSSGITVALKSNINTDIKTDSERFIFDENCVDPAYLQKMLESGEWLLQKVTTDEDEPWQDYMWQGSNFISQVYYTADDAAAEAEYEAAMSEVQKKDKLLELRLEQVETEQSAIQKELESIKGVIDQNVKDSFGTFKA